MCSGWASIKFLKTPSLKRMTREAANLGGFGLRQKQVVPESGSARASKFIAQPRGHARFVSDLVHEFCRVLREWKPQARQPIRLCALRTSINSRALS
jgi:hypothetical protein